MRSKHCSKRRYNQRSKGGRKCRLLTIRRFTESSSRHTPLAPSRLIFAGVIPILDDEPPHGEPVPMNLQSRPLPASTTILPPMSASSGCSSGAKSWKAHAALMSASPLTWSSFARSHLPSAASNAPKKKPHPCTRVMKSGTSYDIVKIKDLLPPISELMVRHGHETRRIGTIMFMRCPFHEERSHSCQIDDPLGRHCYITMKG